MNYNITFLYKSVFIRFPHNKHIFVLNVEYFNSGCLSIILFSCNIIDF